MSYLLDGALIAACVFVVFCVYAIVESAIESHDFRHRRTLKKMEDDE